MNLISQVDSWQINSWKVFLWNCRAFGKGQPRQKCESRFHCEVLRTQHDFIRSSWSAVGCLDDGASNIYIQIFLVCFRFLQACKPTIPSPLCPTPPHHVLPGLNTGSEFLFKSFCTTRREQWQKSQNIK